MRLTEIQRQTIKTTVTRLIGEGSRIWLFGSRVDDTKRGGDIDLMIETDSIIPSRASALCQIEGSLVMQLGDRKIDVLLKDARTADAPIFLAARQKGVLL